MNVLLGPVTYTVTYTDADFASSSLTTANVHLIATGNATGTLSFDNGTGAIRTVTINNISGNGTLGISIDAGSGVDLSGNTSPASGPSSTFTVDNVAPTVTISAPSATGTANGPISYLVSYADAHFGSSSLSAGDVTLNATGTATGTIGVSGAGTSYLVTISNITGNGTLGISLAAGTAVDLAGNPAPAAGPSGTFAVDHIPPTISISPPSATLASAGPVTYTVTYGDTNFGSSNLTTANVHLVSTGTASGTLSFDNATGAIRIVTINNLTGNGTLGIAIDAGSGVDVAGNAAPASGNSATFTVDTTPVTVTISKPSVTATVAGPVRYTVTFSDPDLVNSSILLTPGQVVLNTTNGNMAANISVVPVANTNNTKWTVTLNGFTGGKGVASISIAGGVAFDQAGNTNLDTPPSTAFSVVGAPHLAITPSYATAILPGGAIVYRLTITNTGSQTSLGAFVQEAPPAGTIFSLANNPGWTAGATPNTFVYNIGNLGRGASRTVTFRVSTPASIAQGSVLSNAVAVLDSIGVEASTNLITTIKKFVNGRWIPTR
jgi:hypothetical protein